MDYLFEFFNRRERELLQLVQDLRDLIDSFNILWVAMAMLNLDLLLVTSNKIVGWRVLEN